MPPAPTPQPPHGVPALRTALALAASADAPLPHYPPVIGNTMLAEVVAPAEPRPDDPAEPDLSVVLSRALLKLTIAFESARPPYLAQTERLLADPRGALPRHPLVLHRGGYPDGS